MGTISARQAANLKVVIEVMWPSVPPANVFRGEPAIGYGRVGRGCFPVNTSSHFNFIEWCELWPDFQAARVASQSRTEFSHRLFGTPKFGRMIGPHWTHDAVLSALKAHLATSEVRA